MARFFGTPEGVAVGQLFIDRRDLHEQHMHRPLQAGISGAAAEGADSIVVSGGYVDDEDYGDYIVYTGHGGNDPSTGRQIADQTITASGNAALVTSMVQGLPVRVIRKAHKGSEFGPPNGFQYAGLYGVASVHPKVGRDGFKIIQFRLERLPDQAKLWASESATIEPAYATATVTRRVRDTALSRSVKALYHHECQVCGTAVPAFGERLYSEGAHVRPLGRPHLGDDNLANILCLCPNHHSQLDLGGMVILDDLSVASTRNLTPFAELSFRKTHRIDVPNAVYHRKLWVAA